MTNEITIKVNKIVKETSAAKFFHNSVQTGSRPAKVTLYQATATHTASGLFWTSLLSSSRRKAIESATKSLESMVNSAKAQGLI